MTFREAARRVVEEGILPSMSHQRISQLHLKDPDNFPEVQQVGRSKAIDWKKARPYFLAHAKKAAARDRRRRVESKDEPE